VKIAHRIADTDGMRTRLYLHHPPLLSLEPPGIGPQLAGFLGGLALTFFFGAAATLALLGYPPRPTVHLPWEGQDGVRWLTLVLGVVSCFASVLVTSGFGIKLFAILPCRMGGPAILESEGPCRLVQDAPGHWGLQMAMSESRTPAAPRTHDAGRSFPASCCLCFRLDEAAAGAVSHLTSPDEALVLRWIDLPPAVGGPTLLEVRSPLREIVAGDITTEIRRAA
jgi:hypothetical protein